MYIHPLSLGIWEGSGCNSKFDPLRWIWVASDARDKSQGHFARQTRDPPQIAAKATIWSPEGRPRCRHYSQSLPTWKLNKPRQVARVHQHCFFIPHADNLLAVNGCSAGRCALNLCLLWVLNTSKYAASFVPRQHPFRMTKSSKHIQTNKCSWH